MKGRISLFKEIMNAHESDTLSPPDHSVQKALLYENFLATQTLLDDCDINQIDDLDPDNPTPGHIDNNAPLLSNCIQHPLLQDGPFTIQRLAKATDFTTAGANGRLISFLATKSILQTQRVRRFAPVLRRWLETRHLLWLFEQSGPIYDNPRHFMQQLGLFGHHGIQVGEWLLLLTMEVSRLRKPDWIDAEMAFYFDAAPDARHHGWTRCLRTGHQCRREWVCTPIDESLSLVDVVPLQLDEDITTLTPDADFWEFHRKRMFGGNNG